MIIVKKKTWDHLEPSLVGLLKWHWLWLLKNSYQTGT